MNVLLLWAFTVGFVMQNNEVNSQELDTNIAGFFDSCVGNWDVTYKNWGTGDIHKKPKVFSATATSTLFGESWIISEVTLENGMKIKSTLGYCAKDKAFSGCSIVNFSPFMQQQNGRFDSETSKLTLFTKDRDVISGEETEGKIELVIVDSSKRIRSTFRKDLKTGQFKKNGEMTFTRQQKNAEPEKLPGAEKSE